MTSHCKIEPVDGFCQCCLSESNLTSMVNKFNREGTETYAGILKSCFSIVIGSMDNNVLNLICDLCAVKLKNSYSFRSQIEETQLKLSKSDYARCSMNDGIFADTDIKEENFPMNEYSWDMEEDVDINNMIQIKDTKVSSERKRSKYKKGNLSRLQLKLSRKKNKMRENKNMEIPGYEINILKPERAKTNKPKKIKLEKTAVTCEICVETFSSHRDLVSHMAVHFPNFVCDLCGKPFLSSHGLKTHLKCHNEDKVSCAICNKKLKQSSMSRHVKKHSGERDIYACPHCPERFNTFSLRLTHLSEAHDVKRRRYKCNICPRTFSLSHHRSAHVRKNHLQEKNHTCTECGKAYFGSTRLKEHMLKHTGERKFKCEVCLKSYPRKFTLMEHMKIHNNIKQYVCSFCDKAFTQKCTLKGHVMKIHAKETQEAVINGNDTIIPDISLSENIKETNLLMFIKE